VRVWTGFKWLRLEECPVVGSCEHSNEPLDSVRNFLTNLVTISFLTRTLYSM